jgi:hypothetical protein
MTMSDWLDGLAGEIKEAKQRKEIELRTAQLDESRLRGQSRSAFDEMDKESETLCHMVNARLYEQRRELVHRYIDNTITGDQFLLRLRNLTMEIRMDVENGKVTYNTQSFHLTRADMLKKRRGSHKQVEAATGGLFFERDSVYGILRIGDNVYSPKEAAQFLIGVLVKAAEGVISD